MYVAEYFDTPEQAEETKQQMRLLGWTWCSNFNGEGGVFIRWRAKDIALIIRPTIKRVVEFSNPWMWYCYKIDERFSDPVSCAVALEIRDELR